MFTQPPEFLDVQPLNFCMAQRRERARTDAGRNNMNEFVAAQQLPNACSRARALADYRFVFKYEKCALGSLRAATN